jgi:mismatch-specific thymine-DNA glycosylase
MYSSSSDFSPNQVRTVSNFLQNYMDENNIHVLRPDECAILLADAGILSNEVGPAMGFNFRQMLRDGRDGKIPLVAGASQERAKKPWYIYRIDNYTAGADKETEVTKIPIKEKQDIESKPKILPDILPKKGRLKILFIAKTPVEKSVEAGHYFQGKQGQSFWNQLQNYEILTIKPGTFEDENLLDHNYGITDIVKSSHEYGDEPTKEEYKAGKQRILDLFNKYKPEVLVFVYKSVLDKLLEMAFKYKGKTNYGFNPHLKYTLHERVFVMPLPGVGSVSSDVIDKEMKKLKEVITNKNKQND